MLSGFALTHKQHCFDCWKYVFHLFALNDLTLKLTGDKYYRQTVSDIRNPIDPGYPRDLSVWSDRLEGVKIDAVFQYDNKKTYFFTGHEYYKYDDKSIEVSVYHHILSVW